MKIITEITTMDVLGDEYQYESRRKPKVMSFSPGDVMDMLAEDSTHEIEFIQGRRFVDERGNILVIGMTSEVQKTLGVPFDAIENMMASLERYRIEEVYLKSNINRYQSCISKLGRTGFWKRLKFLFTGIIIEEEPRLAQQTGMG